LSKVCSATPSIAPANVSTVPVCAVIEALMPR
jgi:hypothetical protein